MVKLALQIERPLNPDYDNPLLLLLHEQLHFAGLNAQFVGSRLESLRAVNISDESRYTMDTVQNMFHQNINTLKVAIECIQT